MAWHNAGRRVEKCFPAALLNTTKRTAVPNEDITSLFTNHNGELFITSVRKTLLRFADGRFESVIPNGLQSRSWGNNYLDLQAINGDWWIPAKDGLRVYPKPHNFVDLGNLQPKKIYTKSRWIIRQ